MPNVKCRIRNGRGRFRLLNFLHSTLYSPHSTLSVLRFSLRRYLRAFGCIARYCLLRDMMFRGNFLLLTLSDLLWLILQIIFFEAIYLHTDSIAGWDQHQMLILIGTVFMVRGLFDVFFLANITQFAELIRTGHLDFVLVKPIHPQFLISLGRVNYTSVGKLVLAAIVCVYAVLQLNTPVTIPMVALYLALLLLGTLMAYALLLMMSSLSIWWIRNQGVMELWFYVLSLSRYPADIYRPAAGGLLSFALTFIVPVLILANVPAHSLALGPQWYLIGYMFLSTIVLMTLAHRVLKASLNHYRSASS